MSRLFIKLGVKIIRSPFSYLTRILTTSL